MEFFIRLTGEFSRKRGAGNAPYLLHSCENTESSKKSSVFLFIFSEPNYKGHSELRLELEKTL